MKQSVFLILVLSILLILLTLFFQSKAQTIPRWWGWLVGGVDTLAEDGILVALV